MTSPFTQRVMCPVKLKKHCQLKIGTCHLPLQGLNHKLLWLLTFNTSWKEFRVEIRNEALCALGKPSRTGLQIVRYYQEKILRAQFLHLLISRKALKSFMVTSAPCDYQQPSAKMCAWLHVSPFTKITYIQIFPPTSSEQFLRAIWNAASQAIVLILPQIKLFLILCLFKLFI